MNNINFRSFEEAGQAILKFLSQRFGFKLWMITRTEDDDWIVLLSEDNGYNIKPGQVFHWADSFCSHMVQNNAPRIVPYSPDIQVYTDAPINKLVTIKAYIGQPLFKEDGSLFGTLCAIDPEPQSKALLEDAPLFDLIAKMLSFTIQAELKTAKYIRKAERFEMESLSDPMTGLFNRRAWDQLIKLEEERCKLYGHPTAVIMIDLNDLKITNDTLGHAAGDELIQRMSLTLKDIIRSNDIVARLGGDEFAVLSIETNLENAKKFVLRIQSAFAKAGISAAIGLAMRNPTFGLVAAITEADAKMYQNKVLVKSNNN
ncbi:sensor domain-containing diguanylate cyclase [Acinetobacter sp. ANC 4779]|uniref:sensor domain-containing diguanylate cyclase n=1 Tax=Acinetobacter sp. ANC 4779 TaxID=2529848 RepID=UPI00103EDED2|nr:sensor domain-containing diguanylate cyclase [Acinetobacter sp. ANC 4779]TCB50997.1 sensor domain-containing diguanylate cyclase [Acinetobacter sp. ANC 4779]